MACLSTSFPSEEPWKADCSSSCCWPIIALIIIAKTAIVVPQQSAYVVERLGRYSGTLERRLSHPRAVHGRDSLQALAQGSSGGHPGAGLHHTRQRAGAGGRHALPQGPESGARVLRHLGLSLRDFAAGADDAAQRDRQDRSRPDVRRAHEHQPVGGRRARQGLRAVGRRRCCATRSRTSRRRTTCSPRWKSRCAPSAKSAQ